MYDDAHAPPADAGTDHDEPRYRTVEFTDGLVIYDRRATRRWIHSDLVVSLGDVR